MTFRVKLWITVKREQRGDNVITNRELQMRRYCRERERKPAGDPRRDALVLEQVSMMLNDRG